MINTLGLSMASSEIDSHWSGPRSSWYLPPWPMHACIEPCCMQWDPAMITFVGQRIAAWAVFACVVNVRVGRATWVCVQNESVGGRVGRPPRIYNNVSTRVCWHSTNGKPLTAMCCVQCFTPRCLMYISDYPPSNKLSMASVYWRRCIYPLFAHPFTT